MTEQEIKSEIKGSLLRLAEEEKIPLNEYIGIKIYLENNQLSFFLLKGIAHVKLLTLKEILSWAAYSFFKAKIASFFYQKLQELSVAYNIVPTSINVRIYLMHDHEPKMNLYADNKAIGELKIIDGSFVMI